MDDPCARKHGNNEQSVAAFAKVDTQTDCQRIMSYFEGGGRYTAKEVAAMMGRPFNTISGRFVSLRGGKLRKTGVVRDGSAELEAATPVKNGFLFDVSGDGARM